jgi:hypothetical protein
MGLNFNEVNVLGQIINDSWGGASTAADNNTSVVKISLQGEIMIVTALCIVNLLDPGQQHKQIASVENDHDQLIKKRIAEIKKEFKSAAGRALKCKQVKNSEDTNVEIINHYAATRSSYVRRTIKFEIG